MKIQSENTFANDTSLFLLAGFGVIKDYLEEFAYHILGDAERFARADARTQYFRPPFFVARFEPLLALVCAYLIHEPHALRKYAQKVPVRFVYFLP